jgi:hypothetical protein
MRRAKVRSPAATNKSDFFAGDVIVVIVSFAGAAGFALWVHGGLP